mmetsp:Transcript_17148/g.27042  ORF Transcript_17148/g.27042 Transcript_17148/m.27042 type:complete len:263 (+) Transcript_17148:1569-2357(+)
MKILPCPRPSTMGEPLRATTISSGFSRSTTARPQLPSHRSRAWSTAARRSGASCRRRARPTSCAITSESVSEENRTPSFSSSLRSSWALLMVPLCTKATRPSMSVCGWAFWSVFPPCVAQRVCAMPTRCPRCAPEFASRSSTESAEVPREAYLVTTRPFSGHSVHSPAESYPRLRRICSPSSSTSLASSVPMTPTIPQLWAVLSLLWRSSSAAPKRAAIAAMPLAHGWALGSCANVTAIACVDAYLVCGLMAVEKLRINGLL